MSLYICQHLGLGDHFICSGLIRVLHKRLGVNRTFVYAEKSKMATVEALYSDTKGLIKPAQLPLDFTATAANREKLKHAIHNAHNGSRYLEIGFKPIGKYAGASFDDAFYYQSGIDFKHKWSSFVMPSEFIDPAPVKQNIAFVHDDEIRDFVIEDKFIGNKNIVRPISGKYDNLLTWLPTIQAASEIHCIDSSFINLIDLLDESKIPMCHEGNLFFHKYSRGASPSATPHLLKRWRVVSVPPFGVLLTTQRKKAELDFQI